MKILTIAATPFFSNRGCHIRIYNEAKYLKKMGADVRICAYHLGENVAGLDIVRTKGSKWYKKTSPGFSWAKIWLDLKLLFLAMREIRRFRPDVIHAHLYEGLAIGYLAKNMFFRKIPLVFDLQGNIEEEFASYNKENRIASKMFVWLSKKVSRFSDYSVISSENMLEKIPEKIRRSGNISVIKDGIDLELMEVIADPNLEEMEKIGRLKKWKGKEKVLMYIGGLSDGKGVGELLAAFSELSRTNQNWKLALLGYGPDEEKYRQFIKENEIENLVMMPGKTNYFSMPHYLTSADAVIDPKKGSSESSGKLAGYMAFNLPIICVESSFTRSRLGNGGFYLNSMSDLKNVLEKIESVEVVEYNAENFSEEDEVKKLYGIFASLIK